MTEEQSIGATCMSGGAAACRRSRRRRRSRVSASRPGVTPRFGLSATHTNRRLIAAGHDLPRQDGPARLALIAVALAHITDDRTESTAKRFGSGDPKALSGIRFDALIRAKEPGQLLRPLVRSLQVIGSTANVAKLATDLYWWNDKVRTDWCFDYHGAADAKPTSSEKESA